MNTTQTNLIRGLSTADFIHLNSVTFVQQFIGQILLALVCWAVVQLPEIIIVIFATVPFVAAWFGGQGIGNHTVKTLGVETAQFFTGISFRWFKTLLAGTVVAFLLVMIGSFLVFGAHTTIALGWANVCLITLVFFYYIEVASSEK